MTNDDRSNEDRTGDGRVPEWGEAPQQQVPAADEPRYGERVDPAPTSTPQYGEHAAPSWGEHGAPSWGEQRPTQHPYAAAAAPAGVGAPTWQGYQEPPARKKTLGVIAFVLGVLSLVVGVVGGYLIGSALAGSGALDGLVQGGSTATPDQQELQRQLMEDPAAMSKVGTGALVVGIAAILGLWAIVQGIIAIATKRGRGWGVFAIVLAVVATIATFVTYTGVAVAGAASGTH